MKILRFKNKDIPFVARVVEKGDGYGLNFGLTHENEEPMIEFYDARYKSNDAYQLDGQPLGYFVSRYNLDTFENVKTGLFLDSGSPEWSINTENVLMVQEWLKEVLINEKNTKNKKSLFNNSK